MRINHKAIKDATSLCLQEQSMELYIYALIVYSYLVKLSRIT